MAWDSERPMTVHEGVAVAMQWRAEAESLRRQLEAAVEALREIATSDAIDNALDPDRNRRLASRALSQLGGQ